MSRVRFPICAALTLALCIALVLLQSLLGTGHYNLDKTNCSYFDTVKEESYVGLFGHFDHGHHNLTLLLESKCKDGYKVPPIVHYVWLSKATMEIHEYISVLSMSKFVKPCFILFHGDRVPAGKWWDRLLSQVKNIVHVRVQPPAEIFGREISQIEHQADILRLKILMRYGGIYTDTDMYALRSFDPLRTNMLTLGREDNISVANGLMLANKNASFLKIWMLTYRAYNADSWGGNSVEMANKLCKVVPSLVHVEETGMIMMGGYYRAVFQLNLDWDESQYSVHLYARFFSQARFRAGGIKQFRQHIRGFK